MLQLIDHNNFCIAGKSLKDFVCIRQIFEALRLVAAKRNLKRLQMLALLMQKSAF